MAPSFPSERKRVEAPRTGLLTCACLQPPSQSRASAAQLQWLNGHSACSGRALAEILSCHWLDTTAQEAGALTVAGQWRNFTAFPSILAIAVMSSIARSCASDQLMSWKRLP